MYCGLRSIINHVNDQNRPLIPFRPLFIIFIPKNAVVSELHVAWQLL